MKTKDPRFPYKLAIVDAIFLIRHLPTIAGYSLRKRWEDDIFYRDSLEVDQVMYDCLRKEASNSEVATQTLDKIFGPDIPEPNYKKGDLLFVKQSWGEEWFLRYFYSFDYTDASVICYGNQLEKGVLSKWDCHAPCPGTLPD